MQHLLRVITLFLISVSLNAFADTNPSAVSGKLNLRIINGTAIGVNRSPLARVTFSQLGETFLCSGALISPRVVLTASHCVVRTPSNVQVLLEGKYRAVEKIRIHPGAHEDAQGLLLSDVALIYLKKSVTTPYLSILTSHSVERGDAIEIFGFGVDDFGGYGQLREGSMKVDTSDSHFVYAVFDGSTSNTCEGDSGGPALGAYYDAKGRLRSGIVAITSGGENPNCTPMDYSYFTNVQTGSMKNFFLKNVSNISFQ